MLQQLNVVGESCEPEPTLVLTRKADIFSIYGISIYQ